MNNAFMKAQSVMMQTSDILSSKEFKPKFYTHYRMSLERLA